MQSSILYQLKYALGVGFFVSFYGVAGLIVWVLGEKFGVQTSTQIVLVALLLLTLPFALVFSYFVSRRNKKKEEAAETEEKPAEAVDAEKPEKLVSPTGNYEEIDNSVSEVVEFLKSSNLGEAGVEAVYSLPWYLVAGTPRSGKSSLVLSSNLDFKTLPSQRESEQKFIRPTGNVEWRVTSDAVFIDTAGRYQSEGADGDEWAALVEAIKKQRPKRPLDGFLLVVNAEKILEGRDSEVEQMAKILRSRLDEVIQRTKVRFPIYLIFTNADAIEGFADSFSVSQREGKNLVWGSTIPLEKTDQAQTLFDGEYAILQDAIMKRRLQRLSAPFSPSKQLRIFNFPLHFTSARRKLGSFVSTLFRPNPFSESPFLRGFYFTASPDKNGGRGAANQPKTIGNSFFTEKLFRDVVLRDKDLVGTFQAQKKRPPIMGWLLTAIGAILVLSVLTLAGVSLYKNKQMLDTASERGVAVINLAKESKKKPLEKTPVEAQNEIDATENLRETLVELDKYERDGAPLYMRMGLYSGNQIFEKNLLPNYFAAVEQRYKEPMIKRLEAEMSKFAQSNPVTNPAKLSDEEEENLSRNYDLLKAYLMLTEKYKNEADATHISTTLKDFWASESKLPASLADKSQLQLDFWAKQIDRESFPRISMDQALIDQTRAKLKAFPAINRFYKRKVTEISKEVDKQIGETTVGAILTRLGGNTQYIEGNEPVQSAYTLEGFQLMEKALVEANEELTKPDWVMGETEENAIAQNEDVVGKVKEFYFRDYAEEWRNFVKGINVKYSRENAADALQTFASEDSPIVLLAKEIARQTNFSSKAEPAGWVDWIFSFFASQETAETGGNTPVEKQFLPLHTFVGENPNEKNPIDKYQTDINAVAKKYAGFSPTKINQISQELAQDDNKNFPQLRTAQSDIESLLKPFENTAAGQELAAFLQEPLENLSTLLGADAQSQIKKNWANKVLPAAKEIEKGYPFEAGEQEVDLKNLTAFLNPVDGVLTKFYNDNLKIYFDETAEGLKVKENSELKFNDEFVEYLNNAFRLQKALFGKSATPKFEYEFSLQPVEQAIIEVTIDGQKVTSEGTASIKLTFPPGTGAETGVFVNFSSTASTSQTSGAPIANSSANSSSSSVNNSNTGNTAAQNPAAQDTNAGSGQLKFPGTWGLFKFFDAGSPEKQAGGEYLLTYTLGGKTVKATVKPSGEDLFDRNLFKSVNAPQDFLK